MSVMFFVLKASFCHPRVPHMNGKPGSALYDFAPRLFHEGKDSEN